MLKKLLHLITICIICTNLCWASSSIGKDNLMPTLPNKQIIPSFWTSVPPPVRFENPIRLVHDHRGIGIDVTKQLGDITFKQELRQGIISTGIGKTF